MLGPKKKAEPSGPAAKRAKRGAVSAVKIEQPPGKYVKSKPFAQWDHLTTVTRISFFLSYLNLVIPLGFK